MKIVKVCAIPMSAPVPEKRHQTDLGTKVKSDSTLVRVEADNGLMASARLSTTILIPRGARVHAVRLPRPGLQELRRETLGAGGLRSELIEDHGQPSFCPLARAVCFIASRVRT